MRLSGSTKQTPRSPTRQHASSLVVSLCATGVVHDAIVNNANDRIWSAAPGRLAACAAIPPQANTSLVASTLFDAGVLDQNKYRNVQLGLTKLAASRQQQQHSYATLTTGNAHGQYMMLHPPKMPAYPSQVCVVFQ